MELSLKHHYALDDAETCAKVVLEAAKLKGVNSLPDLLKATGVPLEPFIDDKNRSAQDALHKGQNQSKCRSFSKERYYVG